MLGRPDEPTPLWNMTAASAGWSQYAVSLKSGSYVSSALISHHASTVINYDQYDESKKVGLIALTLASCVCPKFRTSGLIS